MKNLIICTITLSVLLASAGGAFAEERVKLDDLPDAVKKTIRDQQGQHAIKQIERETDDGRTYYEAVIDRPGKNKVVRVAEDGSLISGGAGLGDRSLRLADLPKPVQQTFRQEARGAKVSDIDKDTENGETVYEIEFMRGGREHELVIREDGSVVSGQLAQDSEDGKSRVSKSDNAASFDRPLASTKKVDFEDLPEAVRRTAREHAEGNRIEDSERGTLDGEVVYEIAFKKDGEHNEIRVSQDGSVVDQISGANVRFPGALTKDEVPAPVQRTIENRLGSAEVNDIDKKTIDGKTVYEVGFKRRSGGAQQEIQIAEDGTVINEPAGAEADDDDNDDDENNG